MWVSICGLTAGAEPPCGWRSVTKLGLQYCKDKNGFKRILDSKVGSSDLLGGLYLLNQTIAIANAPIKIVAET